MVTQAPKRSAVLAAGAFALSCVGLMIFVWTQFGGEIPFQPQGYRIGASFKETGLLAPGADVRVSGVNIGKVTAVSSRGVRSYVTMEIQHEYVPIPVDTRAVLRQNTLLGEAYVELSAGNGSGPKLRDGQTIPTSQVEDTQQLDQVLQTFDHRTQQNLRHFLTGTGTALAGRDQDLSNALGNLDPATTALKAIVGALDQQRGDVRRLISNSAIVLSTLGQHSDDLQSLVTAGSQVLAATANRDAALTATVDHLPPFLAQLRTTLDTLNTTLSLAAPSLAVLRPAAPLLAPALSELITLSAPTIKLLHQAPALLDTADAALPAITNFASAFRPAVDALLPAAREIAPIIGIFGLYNRELVTGMANLAAANEASAPASTPTGSANYLRAVTMAGNESIFGQSVREPSNRDNTNFAPGELAYVARGGLLGFAALIVGGLAALAVRHHGEREVGAALQSRLGERGVPSRRGHRGRLRRFL